MPIKNIQIQNGLAISSDIVIGKAYVIDEKKYTIANKYIKKNKNSIALEKKRFKVAIKKAIKELKAIEVQTFQVKDISTIFCGYRLILEDIEKQQEIPSKIERYYFCAEYAVFQLINKYKKQLSRLKNEFSSRRLNDLEDIRNRLLKHLSGEENTNHISLQESVIIVAKNITPSEVTNLPLNKINGIIIGTGGVTSHTAIIARNRGIPAIVGVGNCTNKIVMNDILVLDGVNGKIIVRPTENIIVEYQELQKKHAENQLLLNEIKHLDAKTLDNHNIVLHANIDKPSDVKKALENGATGIGLYRTEFLYAQYQNPTEDIHLNNYKKIIKHLKGSTFVIRTLDFGADKDFALLPHENNPFLGCRSIRLCFRNEHLLKVQLRAILKASTYGDIKLLFPMISSVEDLKKARFILEETKKELLSENVSFLEDIKIGIMIEIPSAALTCDLMAEYVDFFSIGTNDLIQYTLAVDRTNENVMSYYKPLHPGVLKLIENVIDVGKKHNIDVCLCGEVSKEALLLLIGMGIREFSLPLGFIPEVKKMIRSITYSQAKNIILKMKDFKTHEEVFKYLQNELNNIP